MGVSVGGGTGVDVGRGVRVCVGGLSTVGLAWKTDVAVIRGRLVIVGVIVTKRLCVSVGWGVRDAGPSVLVGAKVSVGTKTVTICSVRAAAVPKLETARSTILIGWRVRGI